VGVSRLRQQIHQGRAYLLELHGRFHGQAHRKSALQVGRGAHESFGSFREENSWFGDRKDQRRLSHSRTTPHASSFPIPISTPFNFSLGSSTNLRSPAGFKATQRRTTLHGSKTRVFSPWTRPNIPVQCASQVIFTNGVGLLVVFPMPFGFPFCVLPRIESFGLPKYPKRLPTHSLSQGE
jgi:hypothetical protein